MGKGTGKKDIPTVKLGVKMAGKIIGGGVDLSAKKESDTQQRENLLDTNPIDDKAATSMPKTKEGVISGGFSKKMGFAAPHSFKKLKPVSADKQKSLGQLPTEVRNKMGFEKYVSPLGKDYDKDMAEERIQIKDDKENIYEDDLEKRESSKKSKNYKM